MSDLELQQRIERLRSDFDNLIGAPFEHFYCPILGTDEPGEIIRGHITPKALGGTAWIPQRADIDSFYGTVAEADLIGIVRDRPKGLAHTLTDPDAARRHKPRIETSSGERIPHYRTNPKAKTPVGHTRGRLEFDGGESDFPFTLKKPLDEIIPPGELESTLHVVVERDYRAAATAAAIKAAHLTCFDLFGYAYVFSYAGQSVAPLLRRFYFDYQDTTDKDNALERYFKEHYSMIRPIHAPPGQALPMQGTLIDRNVAHCLTGDDRVFAIGVFVRFGPDTLVVFIPGEAEAINTYFSFVKTPATSLRTRIGPLFPIGGDPATEVYMELPAPW